MRVKKTGKTLFNYGDFFSLKVSGQIFTGLYVWVVWNEFSNIFLPIYVVNKLNSFVKT